jgi:hypothetical protein
MRSVSLDDSNDKDDSPEDKTLKCASQDCEKDDDSEDEEEGENQHKREDDPDGVKDMDVDELDKDDYCEEPSDGRHLQTVSGEVRVKLQKRKTPEDESKTVGMLSIIDEIYFLTFY